MILNIVYIAIIIALISFLVVLTRRKHMNTSTAQSGSLWAESPHFTPSMSGAYLNYSSTDANHNGSLNPSDLAYPQNMILKNNVKDLEIKIAKLINAPSNARVIINSGATESIANMIWWARNYNPHGKIVGSSYDHSAVKDNCETFGMSYLDRFNMTNLNDNCAMLFLTHVDSKTGSIMNVPNVARNLNTYSFLNEESDSSFRHNSGNPYANSVLQYKPIVVLDATQSIMKIPIDMEKWKLNAVFFSLHKIGGPMGMGVLVVDDSPLFPFKPLIGGKQQHNLRGGTLPLQRVVENDWIFDNFDDYNERKEKWNETFKRLVDAGLNVYRPKGAHLYNTFLISTKDCPMSYINELSKKGIYIGNTSACKNEEIENAIEKGETQTGGNSNDPWDSAVRISFKHSNELSDEVVGEIIDTLTDGKGTLENTDE